jgi:hypothetical protein
MTQQPKVVISQWVVSALLSALLGLFGWLTNRAIKQIDSEIGMLRSTAMTERVFAAEKAALQQEIAGLKGEISDVKEELRDVKRQIRWRER